MKTKCAVAVLGTGTVGGAPDVVSAPMQLSPEMKTEIVNQHTKGQAYRPRKCSEGRAHGSIRENNKGARSGLGGYTSCERMLPAERTACFKKTEEASP